MYTQIQKITSGLPHIFPLLYRVLTNQEVGFSFNAADRCPIGCKCYWRAMGRVVELDDPAVIEFFKERKAQGLLQATIIGGEPYVRPKLLPKIVEIMPANWIVTSGTTPLQHLPRTTHFVSVDGANAETHDVVRRSPGLYDRIIRNLQVAKAGGRFPVFIHTVLNAQNYRQVRGILQTWESNRLADGVLFSTVTDIKGGGDENLLLSEDQRKWIVDELLSAKQEFGGFLCMSPRMINHFLPEVSSTQTPLNCGTAKFVASYDAAGVRIPQCIFSERGNCHGCGCVISSMMNSITKHLPDTGTLKVLARLYTP